ncbi:WLM domain-containing protein [Collybia nuda]|uniref:WLM domain-containing protein n=1 Tax=Collybia nuda TaxID=64659 RepID=A0A9P5YH07_9AGAR|nr:WLM domain-containing protein [Collybia nuda]
MPEIFVQSFTHLKDKPKADRALPMLQRVASLVKPIMRKHAWVLPVLAEFFPESPNLIDVNGGQKILLRLRPAHAPDTFYDESDVVQTMLHELAHNVHGPHDDKFYKFLAGLQDEYDALQRSGYAGEGFFSEGQRLGTNVSHDLPPHVARLKALEAAEKRKRITQVLGSGGRLGGRVINNRNMSPRELAAQAAERRARDEKACGSGALAIKEAEKAAKESIEDRVIDLTMDDSDSDSISTKAQAHSRAGLSKQSVPQSKTGATLKAAGHKLPPIAPKTVPVMAEASSSGKAKLPAVKARSEWSCLACTLLNGPLALCCDACLTERPAGGIEGWSCLTCGEMGMPHDRWSCQFCGAIKIKS